MKIWGLTPQVMNYYFWPGRKSFLADETAFPYWVILAAQEGQFQYRVNKEKGVAGFGDLVVCRPHLSFWRHAISTLSYHVISFQWRDAEGRVVEIGEEMPIGRITINDRHRLSSNFAYLSALLGRVDEWSAQRRNHLVRDILQLYFLQQMEMPQNLPHDKLIDKAVRYLQMNFAQELCMKSTADSLGLSPVQFTRRFRQAMNMTPSEYVTSLRLHQAKMLLLETDLTVETVAKRCGYSSGLYLSRVFSQNIKTSPGAFRKTHRV